MNSFTLYLYFAAFISTFLAYVVYRRSLVCGRKYFTLLMLAVAVWSGAYGFELNSVDLGSINLWIRVEYIGMALVPIAWLVFTLQYTGREKWLTKRNLCMLMVEPVIALLLIWTHNAHEPFLEDVKLINIGTKTLTTFTHGLGFWVNAAYAYLLLLIGTVLVVQFLLRSRNLFRGQIISLLIGVSTPWSISAFYLLGLSPHPVIDPMPFAFTISGLVITWGLLRYRFMEILPVVQDTIIASTPDGVIVLDLHDRITDLNPTAARIFNQSSASVIGQSAAKLFSNHENILTALRDKANDYAEITIEKNQEKRFYDLRISDLINNTNGVTGRVIVLRDITECVKYSENLDRREAILNAVRFAAIKFLSTPSRDEIIPVVLERLGLAAHVSRVYIFENQVDEKGVLLTSQRYEWAAFGISPQINNPDLQSFPLREAGFSRWEKILSQRQSIYGYIEEFPASEQKLLGEQQILSIAVVPIFVGTRWWGFIGYDECVYKRRWMKAEIDALEAAATTLGSYIHRKQTDDKRHQRETELAMLHEISLEITSANELSTLLFTIVGHAVTLLGGTGGGLYLCDQEKQEVRCVTSTNTTKDYKGTVLKFGEGAAGVVAQTGKPLIIDDYRVWEGRSPVFEKEQPFRSVLSAPLMWQGEVLGVIHVLHHHETQRFTLDDLTLLTLFANQAAIALHNAQMYESTQQRAHRMALLNDLTRASLEIGDLQKMLDQLAVRLIELLGAGGSYIALWDESRQQLKPAAAFGSLRRFYSDGVEMPVELNMIETVIRSGKILILPDDLNTQDISPLAAEKNPLCSLLALPLITGEQKIGAAVVVFDQAYDIAPDDIAFGELAASQIALIVAKTKLIESELRRVDELDALRATLFDISSQLELSKLLRTILERATSLLDATGGELGLYDEERKEILIVVSHNLGRDYTGTRMLLGEGAMGRAIQLNEPVVISNYHQWEGRSPQYEEGPWYGVLAVPLNIRGRIVGALGIVDANPQRTFLPADQRLLHLFAQQAAIAIMNAHLYEGERKRAVELEILFESSTAMTNTLDLPKVYNAATEQLANAVDATSAYILSCDLAKGIATVLAEYVSPHANERELVSDLGLIYDLTKSPQTLDALHAGKPTMTRISDPHIALEDLEEMSCYGAKSVIKVPMIVSGRLLGYAEIWESRSERVWSDDEICLCQTLANQAAIAIENARLYDEMQLLAVTDELTGVYNRRGFFEAAKRVLTRAYRYHRPLSAIMMDIDHFKRINDIYSHAVGDKVLQALAKLCQANLRESDIFGRYGGEEFVIVLPDTGFKSACQISERLRQVIADTPVLTEHGPVAVTVSMGVACTTYEIEELPILLDRADSAMYTAKTTGRNQVAIQDRVTISLD
jgi:diguanylate cyclase (GGDEF)-like protein/PAS domain S-box-containing protein